LDWLPAAWPASPVQIPRFLPGEFRIKHVTEPWERRGCAALRREVFCVEQKIFEQNDADVLDARALPIAAIACLIGQPEEVVGTVRIVELEPGLWAGSRLAVHRDHRRSAWLGTELIRHAVGTAHARGARRFLAQVQVQNLRLFEQLHWQTLQAISVQGRPHVLMQADLGHYPPRVQDEIAFYTAARRQAA
jgi:putative N-acetyltransferase (TIGR04045 family)